MITSHISGRLRFRHRALKEKKVRSDTVSSLRLIKGVYSVKENEKVGSILIGYDPTLTNEEELHTIFFVFEEQKKSCLCIKKIYSALPSLKSSSLLPISYVGTIFGLFLGRRVHVWVGSVFAILSLIHMIQKSK